MNENFESTVASNECIVTTSEGYIKDIYSSINGGGKKAFFPIKSTTYQPTANHGIQQGNQILNQ